MEVNLAKTAGFCFGVKRAIDIALKSSASYKKVFMLGDIVHNEKVVKQIEESGIKRIKQLSRNKNGVLLARAHGTDLKTLKKAVWLGYKIVDATCPMVKEIHKIVTQMENKGFRIIVIGDKKHDEVKGIIGQLKQKAIVIENAGEATPQRFKGIKKACVVVQSTQNLQKVLKIVDTLKKIIREVRFFNTICKPTRLKQEEIRTLPIENDTMIIIGSKHSANTKRLYEISKTLNTNTYWINSKEEIRREWFSKDDKVGVTAGASTPESTIKDIVKAILKLRF